MNSEIPSGYYLFLTEKVKELRINNGLTILSERVIIANELWNALSEAEKQAWQAQTKS